MSPHQALSELGSLVPSYDVITRQLKGSICGPSRSGCLRIFDFDPSFRGTRPIGRVELLLHNALMAEFADGFEHLTAVALGVLDVRPKIEK
jgi:hypothetical protein